MLSTYDIILPYHDTISQYHNSTLQYHNFIISYYNSIISYYNIIISYYHIKIELFNFVPNCTPYHSREDFLLVTWKVKVKENILRVARRKRPEDIMFLHDLSKRTLERRQKLIPEMLQARKQGKIAYMVMDKLIIHDRKKLDDDNSHEVIC